MIDEKDTYVDEWLASFASTDEILARPDEEEDWLIRGLLRPTTYMIVFGKEGLGKSRILYQLAKSFSDGAPWLGFEVCARGNVLFLEADMAPKESKAIIRDGHAAGFHAPNAFFPTQFGFIDVLQHDGAEVLRGLQERLNPRVVVVDTATDVFTSGSGDNINEPIRDAVRAFRVAFPNAGIIFVLHERKTSQFLQAKGVEDEDAALGGGEWGRKASGVLRLKGKNETQVEVQVRKTRDVVPFRAITLTRDDFGFFHIARENMSCDHALALWPNLPNLKMPSEVSISSVCRSIEDASEGKLKLDALRKSYQRAKRKKVFFPWEKGLGHDSGWDK